MPPLLVDEDGPTPQWPRNATTAGRNDLAGTDAGLLIQLLRRPSARESNGNPLYMRALLMRFKHREQKRLDLMT